MSRTAHVDSVESIKAFRGNLQVFCEEATEALISIELEVRRTLDWLQQQGIYWQRAIRDRQDEVAQAKAELFRRELASMNGRKPDCIEQKKALRRAQERLKEAEEKTKKCKEWHRIVERARDEYEGPARQLQRLVEGKSPAAVTLLHKVVTSLDAYTAVAPSTLSRDSASHPMSPAESAAPAATEQSADGGAASATGG